MRRMSPWLDLRLCWIGRSRALVRRRRISMNVLPERISGLSAVTGNALRVDLATPTTRT